MCKKQKVKEGQLLLERGEKQSGKQFSHAES